MTTQPTVSLVSVDLTREELLLLVRLLGATSVPGLSFDEQEPAEIARGLEYAEQSLRVRGLASIREDGHLAVERTLLEMVATILGAEQMVTVYRNVDDEEGTFFAYRRDDAVVVHLPQGLTHSLLAVPAGPAAVETVLFYVQWPDLPEEDGEAVGVVPQETFQRLSEFLREEQTAQAIRTLAQHLPPTLAEMIVHAIEKASRRLVSLVYRLRSQDEERLAAEVMLFQAGPTRWGLRRRAGEEAYQLVRNPGATFVTEVWQEALGETPDQA